jgi:hypothetical protein
MFKQLNDRLPSADRRFLSVKERTKRTFSLLSSLILLVFSFTLLANGSFSPFHWGKTQAFASQSYPPSGAAHYLYVFPDGNMYVYDLDNNFNLVYSTSLPTSTGVRGVVASPVTGMLYVSYG